MKTTNDYYYGIRGVRFIWRGEWADSEVSYKGRAVNVEELTGQMWCHYIGEMVEKGEDLGARTLIPDESQRAEESFVKYVRDNAAKVKGYITAYGCKC